MKPKDFIALAKMKLISVLTIVKEPLGTVECSSEWLTSFLASPEREIRAFSIRERKPSNAKKYSIETAEELFNLYSPYTRRLRDLGKLSLDLYLV